MRASSINCGTIGITHPRSRAERIARIDALATLLDTAFLIPGTNIRFGLDALIGLVPGVGDAITTLMSLYIVREARALGVPRGLIARMLARQRRDAVRDVEIQAWNLRHIMPLAKD